MKRFLISRTDSIGDVVLTLPLCKIIKTKFPDAFIRFLGRSYTRDIICLSNYVDEFIDYDDIEKLNFDDQVKSIKALNTDIVIHVFPKKEIAKLLWKAKVPLRIGTSGRWFNYLYVNSLVFMTRRRSPLHEAQLNVKLLRPLGIYDIPPVNAFCNLYGLKSPKPLKGALERLIKNDRFNLILHPLSSGSGREWGLYNFSELIKLLPTDKFRIFITGTSSDGLMLSDWIKDHPQVVDMTGKLSLSEFIGFINQCDGLIASSTGPLHLAAALGKIAVGIYPPIKPAHPGRWAPVGPFAGVLVVDKDCKRCKKGGTCFCMEGITARQVYDKLREQIHLYGSHSIKH